MPRSKKSQEVFLTQTSKKTRDHKQRVIQDIRNAIDEHKTLYIFSYENMRSQLFKKIRMDFRSARIFLGKNKLMQIALGKQMTDEYSENLHLLSKYISGSVGLFLTNESHEHVENYFTNLVEQDYAKAGSIAVRTVEITADMLQTYPPSMVDQFRQLGLPVDLKNGKLEFVSGQKQHYRICSDGDTLSVESCKLLHQFGIKMAEFKVKLVCRWVSMDGSIENEL